jgi:oligopeptide/dipeptide ABC transporter ATP-binding protein
MAEPLLEVRDLRKYFPAGRFLLGRVRAWVKAVDDISFTIQPGETLGLVGESGCGKTTTCKLVLAAEEATAGAIVFEGRDIVGRNGKDLRDYRRNVQVVFQDPYSSLSPRLRVGDIIGEPMLAHEKTSRAVVRSRVGELLELVGLRPDMTRLFPHEFSGGQRQRIAIARALSTNARLIVLDEPVSALDVSIRAHIIALLEDIQKRLGVSYLFVGHDLAAVAHISHRIAVMYLGKIVEVADSLELCHKPLHPYTKALFAASLPSHPDEEREKIVLTGEVPSALNPPSGCHFHPRCPFAMPHCSDTEPEPIEFAPGHTVACHLYSDGLSDINVGGRVEEHEKEP